MSKSKVYNSRNGAFTDWWRARLQNGKSPLTESEMGLALEAFNAGAVWATKYIDGELEAPAAAPGADGGGD